MAAFEFDEFAYGQLQRDVGRAAARVEEERRETALALEAERLRSADLERRLQAAESSAAAERRAAGEAGEIVARREQVLRAEMERLRDAHDREVASLRSEAELLHSQLREARSLLAGSSVASSSPSLATCSAEEEERQAALVEAEKLRREVSGMSVLVNALRKKVQVYESRLMEQARTCADELNDLRSQVSEPSTLCAASRSGACDWEDADLLDADEQVPVLDFDLTSLLGSTGLGSSLKGLGSSISDFSMGKAVGGDAGGYLRLDDDNLDEAVQALAARRAKASTWKSVASDPEEDVSGLPCGSYGSYRSEERVSTCGSYVPPSLPDAI